MLEVLHLVGDRQGRYRDSHMDGNTRLCTATAAASLKESFGADGQPGSYADLDVCEVLFCFGHNVAATQTVLWSRILDRLASPDSYAWSLLIRGLRRSPRRPRSIWRRGPAPTSRWSMACCSS